MDVGKGGVYASQPAIRERGIMEPHFALKARGVGELCSYLVLGWGGRVRSRLGVGQRGVRAPGSEGIRAN